MNEGVTIGLFVGGAGKRMGGLAKGLLQAPGGSETLIERLLRVCSRAAPNATLYLVGRATPYVALGLEALADDPQEVGPIGGLRALLARAQSEQSRTALALACDLPFIDESVIVALTTPLERSARVPFIDGHFQPLAAAYAPTATLRAVDRALASGQHALMRVLDHLGSEAEALALDGAQALALRDWDTPEDVRG